MAWSSYNFFLNNSSPSYGLGWDTTGYTWPQVSPTDSFPAPLTAEPSSMSPNHLLYNHHLQHPSAPLDPKFFMPAASSNLDIYNPNQDVMHHSSLESNGAAKSFPTGGVNPGSGTTTCGTSPYFDVSMQEIPEPKGNASRCARTGMLCRRRGARKHSPSNTQGVFRCNWKGCPYPGMFSRKGVLMRHIETQHVTPRSFGCPKCDRLFSRKDNMTEHLGRVHFESF